MCLTVARYEQWSQYYTIMWITKPSFVFSYLPKMANAAYAKVRWARFALQTVAALRVRKSEIWFV